MASAPTAVEQAPSIVAEQVAARLLSNDPNKESLARMRVKLALQRVYSGVPGWDIVMLFGPVVMKDVLKSEQEYQIHV